MLTDVPEHIERSEFFNKASPWQAFGRPDIVTRTHLTLPSSAPRHSRRPAKRTFELVRMHRYTLGNPCFSFSVGALKSLLPPGTAAPDLSSLPAAAGEVLGDGENDDGSQSGVTMAENGIYVKTEKNGTPPPIAKV